jgi:hypothetical protein
MNFCLSSCNLRVNIISFSRKSNKMELSLLNPRSEQPFIHFRLVRVLAHMAISFANMFKEYTINTSYLFIKISTIS